MTLTYRRKVRKNVDHICDGVLYLHHFGTGYQELVFVSHASALAYATKTGCEYRR